MSPSLMGSEWGMTDRGFMETRISYMKMLRVVMALSAWCWLDSMANAEVRTREIGYKKTDITRQPGFISGKFHKSLKEESRSNFINVAIWDNEEVYWKAYEKSVGPMKTALQQMGVEMTPALFNVIFEY